MDVKGLFCRLNCTDGKVYEGHIYAYDQAMQVVVLQSAPSTMKPKARSHNFHILKLSYIKDVLPLKDDEKRKGLEHLVPITPLSIEKAVAREQAAIRNEKEKLAKIGRNVSVEAQVSRLKFISPRI